MSHWLHTLHNALQHTDHAIVVTVIKVRGSAPRETGAKMLINKAGAVGSIGGGQLEYQCQQLALEFISQQNLDRPQRRNFPLGTNCGQCCGGVVDVLFEPIAAPVPDWLEAGLDAVQADRLTYLSTELGDGTKRLLTAQEVQQSCAVPEWQALQHEYAVCTRSTLIERLGPNPLRIAVFGAGHVGQALVNVLAMLDGRIEWIDPRPGLFTVGADNIHPRRVSDPAAHAACLPSGTLCLVMTHSHALDFDICAKLLARDDIPFCGLIGSASKRARFERLFRQAGLSETQRARLTCPIGIDGIGGKAPAQIAVAVAAQILQKTEQADRPTSTTTYSEEVPGAAVST